MGPNQPYWQSLPSDIGLIGKFLENFSGKKENCREMPWLGAGYWLAKHIKKHQEGQR
jgi:hypothetical protein